MRAAQVGSAHRGSAVDQAQRLLRRRPRCGPLRDEALVADDPQRPHLQVEHADLGVPQLLGAVAAFLDLVPCPELREGLALHGELADEGRQVWAARVEADVHPELPAAVPGSASASNALAFSGRPVIEYLSHAESTGPWPGATELCRTSAAAPIAAESRGFAAISIVIPCAWRANEDRSVRVRMAFA